MKTFSLTALTILLSFPLLAQKPTKEPFRSIPNLSGIYLSGHLGAGTGLFTGTSLNIRSTRGTTTSLAYHHSAWPMKGHPYSSIFDPWHNLNTVSFSLGKDYRLGKYLVAGFSGGAGVSVFHSASLRPSEGPYGDQFLIGKTTKYVLPGLVARGKLQLAGRFTGLELGLTTNLMPKAAYVGIDLGLLIGAVNP